ncbi:MAG: DUF4129 domain-containing protein [Lachnospiraceae bacterium]|nr:DUF4129 domain-containing protein [Lachnospiraceae bacterium]
MDVLVLRLLLDAGFFMAVFNPLISGGNYMLKWGLRTVLAAWLVWIVVNWKKKDLAGRVHDIVLTEVKMLAVIQVYELVIQGFAGWQEKCAPYVCFFAVVAILLLRAGRLVGGSQEKSRFWGANGVEIVSLLAVTMVLSSDVVKSAAWKLLGGIYMNLILPVLLFFLSLLQMVLMMLEPILGWLFSGFEQVEYEPQVDSQTAQDFLPFTGNETLTGTPVWAKMVGMACIVLILAVIFYFLYKKLSLAGSGRDREIRGEVKKSTLGVADRKAAKRRSLFEEKNVRYYYRRFLELCRKNGMEPETVSVTSEMMQRIAVENWGEEESVGAFTDLYREVRYGGKVDEEPERKTAKSLYKKMKNIAENSKKA